MLRSIPPSFDQDVVARIDARLADIRVSHAVGIPLAIESGSRAWGFPSPDSDYDSRFVFVRRLEDYLSPWPKRDVIETPLDGILDVNGWDLRKALTLLLKGNAVILEWAQSPIQYGVDPWFQAQFLALATEVANRHLIIRHYHHTADRQREPMRAVRRWRCRHWQAADPDRPSFGRLAPDAPHPLAIFRHLFERLIRANKSCLLAGQHLPAPHDRVAVDGVVLDQPC